MTSPETRALERQLAASRKADRKDQPKRVMHKRVEPVAEGQRQPRKLDKSHKGFIATLPCLATLIRTGMEAYGVQVAHQRFSWAPAGVTSPGMGRKPDDWRTLPLSPAEHHRQHARGDEIAYWEELGLDPQTVCNLGRVLKRISGDHDAALNMLHFYARVAKTPDPFADDQGFPKRTVDGRVISR